MNSTTTYPTIATNSRYCESIQEIANSELNTYLEAQVQAIALDSVRITVPQRRANPNDKNRLRWAEAKIMALAATGCVDTSEVRKWLNALGVGSLISLRRTSGWVCVRVDLADVIRRVKAEAQRKSALKIVQMSDYREDDRQGANNVDVEYRSFNPPEPGSDIEILYHAMLNTIASKNWEFTRLALIGREQCKADAWELLMHRERMVVESLVPVEIKILKKSLKSGAIVAFKEHEEGSMFWIWGDLNSEPKLVSSTSVRSYRFLD